MMKYKNGKWQTENRSGASVVLHLIIQEQKDTK